jgi:hypothetical protein
MKDQLQDEFNEALSKSIVLSVVTFSRDKNIPLKDVAELAKNAQVVLDEKSIRELVIEEGILNILKKQEQ